MVDNKFMEQFKLELMRGLAVMEEKRRGYGNSLEETGIISALLRVKEKLNRLTNITDHGLRVEIVNPADLREMLTDIGNLCFAGNVLLRQREEAISREN